MRILALHGKQQNKEVFRTRLGQLPRKLKKFGITFHVVEAPHDLPLGEGDSVAMKSWFERIGFESVTPESLETTLSLVEREWNQAIAENDPFTCIFGFSQGGTLTGIIAGMPDRFPGLKCCCCIGAPNNAIVQADKIPKSIISLHCAGETDSVVPNEASKALSEKFTNAQWEVHGQGHCIPSRSADQKVIVEFFETSIAKLTANANEILTKAETETEARAPARAPVVANEEALEGQMEELEALLGIYGEALITVHAAPSKVGDPTLSFSALLSSPDLPPALEGHIAVVFTMPPSYPEGIQSAASIELDTGSLSLYDLPSKVKSALLTLLRAMAAECAEMQSQCAFACIQAALDWLANPESIAAASATSPFPSSSPSVGGATDTGTATGEGEEEEDVHMWWHNHSGEEEGELSRCDKDEELEETMMETATKHAAVTQAARLSRSGASQSFTEHTDTDTAAGSVSDEVPSEDSSFSTRGVWKYVIGLVGKPSAGKSTFYNAATKACLQRSGRLEAQVGAHPFTTIEPNTGPGYFLGPPESDNNNNKGYCHGIDEPTGRRLLPVIIKDVAGLVPGAYKGRGKGNKFLNDLTDADCLVHVVDASGFSDSNGHIQDHSDNKETTGSGGGGGGGGGGAAAAGGSSPDTDAKWVRQELHRWIFHNVRAKWFSVVRLSTKAATATSGGGSGAAVREKALTRMVSLFTGYNCTPATVLAAVRDASLNPEAAATYSEQDVHMLVAHFLQRRFPICIALNKIDLVQQQQLQLQQLEGRMRECQASALCRGELAVPVCAVAEYMALKQDNNQSGRERERGAEATKTAAAAADGQKALRALGGCSCTVGVLAALTAAVSMRPPVYVYPVSDLDTLAPLGGNNGSNNSVTTNGTANRLQDCVLVKPGSTVGDVFSALKAGACPHARLNGEFVRCTGLPHPSSNNSGSPDANANRQQLGKDSVIRESSMILHVQSNRKSVWQ